MADKNKSKVTKTISIFMSEDELAKWVEDIRKATKSQYTGK